MERDIDRLWEKCCAAIVGPIIGHASIRWRLKEEANHASSSDPGDFWA